jgi:hypothetical protein
VLRSGDLSGPACSWRQEVSYLFALISLGQATLRLAFSQAPGHIERKNMEDLEPLGLATPMLALAKPPSMSRGGVYSMRKEEVVLNS